jgi:hypothetical protein
MIEVESLFLEMKDLLRKDHAGYTSTDEYNRSLVTAQSIIFNFYVQIAQETTEIIDALAPFVEEAFIEKSGDYYPDPDDYRHKLEVGAVTYESGGCDGPIKTYHPARVLKSGEVLLTLSSPIRGPKLSDPAVERLAAKWKIYPESFVGNLYLKYYRTPAVAERGFTLNVTTQEEEYDPTTTTDLEWRSGERESFIDVLLALKGLALRENPVVQWAASRQDIMSIDKQLNQIR